MAPETPGSMIPPSRENKQSTPVNPETRESLKKVIDNELITTLASLELFDVTAVRQLEHPGDINAYRANIKSLELRAQQYVESLERTLDRMVVDRFSKTPLVFAVQLGGGSQWGTAQEIGVSSFVGLNNESFITPVLKKHIGQKDILIKGQEERVEPAAVSLSQALATIPIDSNVVSDIQGGLARVVTEGLKKKHPEINRITVRIPSAEEVAEMSTRFGVNMRQATEEELASAFGDVVHIFTETSQMFPHPNMFFQTIHAMSYQEAYLADGKEIPDNHPQTLELLRVLKELRHNFYKQFMVFAERYHQRLLYLAEEIKRLDSLSLREVHGPDPRALTEEKEGIEQFFFKMMHYAREPRSVLYAIETLNNENKKQSQGDHFSHDHLEGLISLAFNQTIFEGISAPRPEVEEGIWDQLIKPNIEKFGRDTLKHWHDKISNERVKAEMQNEIEKKVESR